MREKWPRFERIALTLALAAALVLGTGCEQLMEKNKEDDYNYSSPYYFISFDANGGTGSMDELTLYVYDFYPLPTNTFTRADYEFTGWNTEPDGSGSSYYDGERVSDLASPGSTITLYAQWEKEEYENPYYTVRFDANGGTGSMNELTHYVYDFYPLPPNTFTRADYEFTGWNTASDGNGGRSYYDGEWVSDLADSGSTVTLYAQWLKTGMDMTITITLPETDEDIELTFTQNGSLLTFIATEGCTEYRWRLEDEELDDEETNTLTLDTAGWQKGTYVLVVEAERDGEYYSAYIYITIGGN